MAAGGRVLFCLHPRWHVAEDTPVPAIEDAFKRFTEREDIAIVLINQYVRDPLGEVPPDPAAAARAFCLWRGRVGAWAVAARLLDRHPSCVHADGPDAVVSVVGCFLFGLGRGRLLWLLSSRRFVFLPPCLACLLCWHPLSGLGLHRVSCVLLHPRRGLWPPQIANEIRPVLAKFSAPVPAVLEIPSKEHPYDAAKDSILQRVRNMLGTS